jgi:predicted DNA binding CopG/RHH family protein
MAPKLGQRLVPEAERKKHFVAVRLTDAELQALEGIASREGLPLSYVIRRAIALLIEGSRKKK